MNGRGSNRQKGILAIDDEEDILDVLKKTLEEADFKVHTVSNAQKGVELYERLWREIDLVLLDYLMPEMTGDLVFECLRRINPGARVILLTACDDNVARKMFETGLRGYIQKPFYLDDIVHRVREELSAD
jgi:two-component system, cell cycle sensor histidine kinase and response regulator CckA